MTKKFIKRGRPTKYNTELGREICNIIASTSKGTKKLCAENSHWPCQDTLFTWLKTYPEFSEQYAQAKRCQVELLIDEILEIADNDLQDKFTNSHGEIIFNNSAITRAKLRVDTRKWLASKLVPRVYGTRVEYHPSVLNMQQQDEMNKLHEIISAIETRYEKDY
ncbi:TPA: hypothetical protein RJX14_001139 [Legionella pneumophila]|nr:hypothetical protein [Legionella pneumophila]